MKKEIINSVVGILAGLAIFWGLGAQLNNPRLLQWDQDVLLLFRTADDPHDPIGSSSVEEICTDMGAMGSTVFLTIIVATVLGFCVLKKKFGTAAYFFLLTLLG